MTCMNTVGVGCTFIVSVFLPAGHDAWVGGTTTDTADVYWPVLGCGEDTGPGIGIGIGWFLINECGGGTEMNWA
jgi:hypothetical protein